MLLRAFAQPRDTTGGVQLPNDDDDEGHDGGGLLVDSDFFQILHPLGKQECLDGLLGHSSVTQRFFPGNLHTPLAPS